jgi:integrase
MRRRLIYITRFVLWCWQSCGMPLDRDDIFTASLVDEFAAVQSKTQAVGSVARQRTLLLAVVEELNADAPPSAATATDNALRMAPYNRAELAMLRSWAAGQSTTRRRHNAAVILALGVGAGLRPEELRTIRRDAVETDDSGLTVHLANRSVPMLREWEQPLQGALQSNRIDGYLFHSQANRQDPKLVTDFIRSTSTPEIKPVPQRLRATWLVTQLRARVPLVALLDAAGLNSLESLTPYLGFLPQAGNATDELRDAGGTR